MIRPIMLYTELQISSALLVIFVKASTSVIAGKMNGRREFILVEQIDGWLTRPISVDYLCGRPRAIRHK